jgi:hypothetical protein
MMIAPGAGYQGPTICGNLHIHNNTNHILGVFEYLHGIAIKQIYRRKKHSKV